MTVAPLGQRKRFELDPDELPIFRWIFLLGVIVYPLYWYVQTRFQGQVDPLWLRLCVTAVIGATGLAMLRSEWVERHALLVVGLVLWLMTLHVFFLLWLNHVSTAYIAGLIIIIAVVTVLGTYSEAMVRFSVVYYLANFTVAIIVVLTRDAPKVSPVAFLLGLTTLQGVAFVALRTRVNMVERMRVSQQRYELAAAGSRDGLWDWDTRSGTIYFSPRWKTMMGYEPDATVRGIDDWLARVVSDDRERVRRIIDENMAASATHFEIEYRVSGNSGARWMLTRAIALRGSDGKPYRVAGSLTDIHAQKQAEERLRQLNEQLLDARDRALSASENKSSFLASMSHELRTPLNAIIGYSEILAEDVGEEGLQHLLPDVQRITAAGRHLLSLINNILDLSKIEAGEMEIVRERVELAALLEDASETARPLAARNRNRLELSCQTQVVAFESDRTRLLQILLNLLGNACKFTEDGLVALEVRDAEGGALEFRIRDNGPGIAPERVGHLFTPFFQLESTRKGEGTGLGLTIARHLCQLLGGEIHVETQLGEGSVFWLTIPLQLAETNE